MHCPAFDGAIDDTLSLRTRTFGGIPGPARQRGTRVASSALDEDAPLKDRLARAVAISGDNVKILFSATRV